MTSFTRGKYAIYSNDEKLQLAELVAKRKEEYDTMPGRAWKKE